MAESAPRPTTPNAAPPPSPRTGAFLECVFSCPSCGLGGTSLIRPGRLEAKACLACGDPVVVTVLKRFPRR
jgi:hypothetical protein